MARKRDNGPGGLIVVDKPAGFTSHDVVAKLRGMARTRRVGHAGTLDPMATGVLVVGTERSTRLLGHLALTEKEYVATVRLGQETVTEDAEGEITAAKGAKDLDRARVEAAVAGLTGEIEQVPSSVSAVKVDGKRAYARIRDGEQVELAARPVTVSSFVVHDIREETAEDGTPVTDLLVSVVCSSGTYVRALARDLGAALDTGGHLTALRRTRVGPYRLEGAYTLEQLQGRMDAGEPLPVLPLGEAAAAAFERWDVDEEDARRIGNGVQLRMPAGRKGDGPVAVFGPGDRFVALVAESGGRAKSLAVFV
ncbi:tRNA pseudouridine(55) synthase TruB [Streptomyces albus]|uniref:tRNA pseudouridine(55) synthase TruB n=1 Tax=Streptomyces sp. PHES57 TaxID=2872626 RepID=UPI001CEC4091|nr:tRNA pseudouridine(55) synthase TruB [Streptomyces sp. PHES57]